VYAGVTGDATGGAGIAVFAGRRPLIVIAFRPFIYSTSYSVRGHFRLISPRLATINSAY
jgi:hypothetical protein